MFMRKNKTKLINSLLTYSLIVLGGISTVAYSLTSCSSNHKNESYYTLVNDPTKKIYFNESNNL